MVHRSRLRRRAMSDARVTTPESSLEALRGAFPVTAERSYLFAGGLAPLARPVKEALDRWAESGCETPPSIARGTCAMRVN